MYVVYFPLLRLLFRLGPLWSLLALTPDRPRHLLPHMVTYQYSLSLLPARSRQASRYSCPRCILYLAIPIDLVKVPQLPSFVLEPNLLLLHIHLQALILNLIHHSHPLPAVPPHAEGAPGVLLRSS